MDDKVDGSNLGGGVEEEPGDADELDEQHGLGDPDPEGDQAAKQLLEGYLELDDENRQIVDEASSHLDRALYLYGHLRQKFDEAGLDQREKTRADINWALSELARVEALNPNPPRSAREWRDHLELRELQAFLLLDIRNSLNDKTLNTALKIQAARIHDRTDPSQKPEQLIRETAGRIRGYAAETFSQRIPPADRRLRNYFPYDFSREEEQAYLKRLDDFRLVGVPRMHHDRGTGYRWRAPNIVGDLVVQNFEDLPGFSELKEALQGQGVEIYLHSPFKDPQGDVLEVMEAREDVVVFKFESGKGWVASGKQELLDANSEQISTVEDRVAALNEEIVGSISVPDHIILTSEAGRERVRGWVELKFWRIEELATLVEYLENQSAEEVEESTRTGKLGNFFTSEELNEQRKIFGKEPIDYQWGGLKLSLNFGAQRNYVSRASGENEDALLLILRVSRDQPENLLRRLQKQIQIRDQKVLIQQIPLSADDIEGIVYSRVRSVDFVEWLEDDYAAASEDWQRLRNMKARATALGITNIKDLREAADAGEGEEIKVPAVFDVPDIVTYSLERHLVDKETQRPLTAKRGELIRHLVSDYRNLETNN